MPQGSGSRVLGVFAHPDDETLFAGATLAAYAAAGCDVRLITLTAGEGAELPSAETAAPESDAMVGAGRRRLSIYAAACAALGVGAWEVAEPGRWHDLGPRVAEGSLGGADLAEVTAVVGKLLETHAPDVLVTVGPDGVTGHPDHVRAHDAVVEALRELPGPRPLTLGACVPASAVRQAVERLRVLAPGRRIGDGGVRGVEVPSGPDDAGTLVELRLPLTAGEAKRKALAAYYPQIATEPLEALIDPTQDVGDATLLMTVAELTGYDTETFLRLP